MVYEPRQVTPEQATFFDRIYPSISSKLHSLETADSGHDSQIIRLKADIKVMELTVEQYKKKIQKIEQLLIEYGMKEVLKGKISNG